MVLGIVCRPRRSGNTPAGRTRPLPSDTRSATTRVAWVNMPGSRTIPEAQTHPVGEKQRNGFGLFDMHGNVWEWCWDGYGEGYYKESIEDDPRGPSGASHRVLRGGGWYHVPRNCRSAFRYGFAPEERSFYLGFRVARVQSGR